MLASLSIIAIGFLLGMRHAVDPDHVLAVGTIVGGQRSVSKAVAIGALWGIGHTITILIVGGLIILLQVAIPPRVGLSMELGVAAMLIVLGMVNISGARLDERRTYQGGRARPLVVGLVHGLAGSAAVALLVVAVIDSTAWAVVYLLLFGIGTIVGMGLVTCAIAVPSWYAMHRFIEAPRYLRVASGVASLVFGLVLSYQIGIVDGLFTSDPQWLPR